MELRKIYQRLTELYLPTPTPINTQIGKSTTTTTPHHHHHSHHHHPYPPTHPSLEGSGPDCVCHLWLDRRGAAWVWDQSIIQSENGSVGPRQAGRSLMELLTRPCGLLDNDTVAEPSLQKSQLPRREVTTELIR